MSKVIYIHKENSARATALIKHINSFHPNYIIKNDTIQRLFEFHKLNTKYENNNYLFILNENAIKDYSEEYSGLFYCNRLYPRTEHIHLEISKSYCREFMKKIGLDNINPQYVVLNTKTEMPVDYINKVIKADGLESGKGVFVYGDHYNTNEEAYEILSKLWIKHDKILVEDKLVGEEFSLITLSWKGQLTHFPLIKDFKRLANNDTGPNTGGMGTISFAGGLMPFISQEEYEQCCKINEKVINDIDFVGFLYGSFMKTYANEIKLIEYNVRLGDSEAVNIFGLLESSLINYLDDPVQNPLLINRNKYSYFRYLVPNIYPLTYPGESLECSYFIVNSKIPRQYFYTANCYETDMLDVYRMAKSRTCGILTMNTNIENLIKYNDYYVKMIYGDFNYRTDIGNYFTKNYLQYFDTKYNTPPATPSSSPADVSSSSKLLYSLSSSGSYGVIKNTNTQNTQNYLNHLNNYNYIITNTKDIIDLVNNSIEVANPDIKVIGKIGDFANAIQYKDMKLICSVDGAGTKTKFLEGHPKRFHILGSDIVVHNINDMYCNNGIPIALLDYYGCDKLDKQQFNQFIEGALTVCSEYGIPLIGGETAEMRGIFTEGEVEVLGILLGIVPQSPLNGTNIVKGNYIYGIESNGAHTNGFTKLREIDCKSKMPADVKEFFSQPHKCYVNIMNKIIDILAASLMRLL